MTESKMERDWTQPNPGWGEICERCLNRDRRDLMNASMPCLEVEHRPIVNADPPKWCVGGIWVHAFLPTLTRFTNGKESCDYFRAVQETVGEAV